MQKYFGDEYPAAITVNGIRMSLTSERRWTRNYQNEDGSTACEISRFMDGSASISFIDFVREWPGWSQRERQDFCSACDWLRKQTDFPDMLRLIMKDGCEEDWSAIALPVGSHLPQQEAFDLLTDALRSIELERASNIIQGITETKHADAARVLREHLARLWSHPQLWEDDDLTNWLAYGAINCIGHLIELGGMPQDFADQVRALAKHACSGDRDACRRVLAKYYPWLNQREATD